MDEQFGYEEQDFYFSGGVTAYDGKFDDIIDISIGQVKIYSKQWEGGGVKFTELETD